MDHFAEAFAHTVGVEGRYSNREDDPGGETMWGITVALARASGYEGPMRDMPIEVARLIYLEQFWTPQRLNEVAALSSAVASEVFDTSVNLGAPAAGKILQRALSALGAADIKVDGHIGSVTIAFLKQYLKIPAVRPEREVVLLRCLNGLQLAEYVRQVEARPVMRWAFYGWVRARVVI